jgi:hypothetical protein
MARSSVRSDVACRRDRFLVASRLVVLCWQWPGTMAEVPSPLVGATGCQRRRWILLRRACRWGCVRDLHVGFAPIRSLDQPT